MKDHAVLYLISLSPRVILKEILDTLIHHKASNIVNTLFLIIAIYVRLDGHKNDDVVISDLTFMIDRSNL